jgi:hypothetical protein
VAWFSWTDVIVNSPYLSLVEEEYYVIERRGVLPSLMCEGLMNSIAQ